jgi:hypothetical protein
MARRGSVRGIGRVRRLFRRLPAAVANMIVVELHVTGREILAAAKARTPRATGALVAGESQRVLPKSLRLQIGLLGTPKGRSKLFYGRIQDLGRKAQVVLVERRRRVKRTLASGTALSLLRVGPNGRKRSEDIVATYRMRVPAMPGKRFITGRFPELRRRLNRNLRGIFARALAATAAGGSDD